MLHNTQREIYMAEKCKTYCYDCKRNFINGRCPACGLATTKVRTSAEERRTSAEERKVVIEVLIENLPIIIFGGVIPVVGVCILFYLGWPTIMVTLMLCLYGAVFRALLPLFTL